MIQVEHKQSECDTVEGVSQAKNSRQLQFPNMIEYVIDAKINRFRKD